MKPLLPRWAAVLTTGAAAALLTAAAPSDPAAPAPSAKPAPDWVKMIDQGDLDPRLKGYKTPEGIKVEIVAEDPVVVSPTVLAFADDGTPYVLEQQPWAPGDIGPSKKATFTYKDGTKREWVYGPKISPDVVKTLSDSKGKGVYDQSKVVFEDAVPSDVLLYDGWLYVAGQGTVRRYKRSKADGPFDVKEVVAQGFCGRGWGPHRCGMTIGPDGWLYISPTAGDNIVEGSDGSRATVLHSGAVFRCRPDGSKMEVYALGFNDPSLGVAFDAVSDAFQADQGSVNDDAGKFRERRLMHVVEGADFGWRSNEASSFYTPDPYRAAAAGELPGKLPPMLTTGHGQSGGLLFYNDTRLPDKYRDLLFSPDPTRKLVHAYKLRRAGGTFEVAEEFDLLKSEDPLFQPSQAVLGPDGAVYVVDSRDEKHGRILRLTWAGTKDQPALPPRGMDSWAKIAALGDDDLVKTLSSDDAGDRERARRELAKRGEKNRPALLKLFKDADQPDTARIAALCVLEAMWDGDAGAAAMTALNHDSSADVRRLTADALGLNAAKGDEDVHAVLLRALLDPAAEVRRSAALAMSRVAADGAADNLVNTWASDDGRDLYLRDGLVRAIENLGQPGVDRLIALGESGVTRDMDKVVQAFTMTRTRPFAEAVPRVLENPHLNAAERAALIRSYENYLLDPPVSLAPPMNYLFRRPDEDPVVKQAGAELLAAFGPAAEKATGWLMALLDEKDPKVRTAAVTALASVGAGPEDARRVGQAFLDKKLPPETRPQVADILRRHADKDAECARLLKAVKSES